MRQVRCACYNLFMNTLENNLKTTNFWLKLGAVNHTIALLVIAFGCAYSGFTCQGETMKDVLSIYAFTIFTPQLALEVILLMALFLVSNSMLKLRENPRPLIFFLGTLALLILFTVLR